MTSSILPESALADAAAAVAQVFGLGDSVAPGRSWPVDEGDTVLSAPFASPDGVVTGRLYLAINDDVAKRLSSDAARLASGLAKGLLLIAAGLRAELELGAVAAADDEPSQCVEILDGAKLCALLGVTVVEPVEASPVVEPGEGAGGATSAEAFTPIQFDDPGHSPVMAALGPLSLLQDVDMEVTVELGRTKMPIRDLLALQPGMVVEIDRVAGAPIDVLVNGRRFACGEVVVIDEEFGLRITEIVGAS